MTKRRVVTVISGGMDSVTLAYKLHAEGFSQRFISFDYGQRHAKELQCAERTAESLDTRHDIISLTALRLGDTKPFSSLLSGSSLTDIANVPVPEGHYEESSMTKTIVPGRNAMMLSIAWSIAITDHCNKIACGVHSGDHFIYPDCRAQFIIALGNALAIGSALDFKNVILTPFLYKTKADILKEGLELKVPYQDTWTCYAGREKACGRCGSCVERKFSFAEVGTEDPLEYEDEDFWKTAVAEFELRKHATP